MKKLSFIVLILSFFALQDLLAQQQAQINLAGYKHVPPVNSPGSGVFTVTLSADTLYVEGRFEDLRSGYRGASIHYGSERETGNRIHGLRIGELSEDRRNGTFQKENNYIELRPSILQALRDGNLYISIATERNQRGEIRGQIPAMR